MKNNIVLFALIGLINTSICFAQDVHIKIGVKDSIYSEILNENRNLIVSLPEDYQSSNKLYPTLFLLDGNETSLLNTIVITRYLRAEIIIVAILNTDRDRDMMPLSTPTYKVDNPGAAHFLSFLEKELIPHIDKEYRSNRQARIISKLYWK